MAQNDALQRRQKLTAAFTNKNVDALLVTTLVNCRYLTGFTGSNAALLLDTEGASLFTDPRYTIQAKQQSDTTVVVAEGPLLAELIQFAGERKIQRLGFENLRVSYSSFKTIEDTLPDGVELVPIGAMIDEARMVKSEAEIELIRQSVLLNSRALDKALARFKATMTENDLAAEIEYQMRRLGAEKPAFDTIVASGARSALPHANPSTEPLKAGSLLLIDMGAFRQGYASDMTRMGHLGKVPRKTKKLYDAVLEAQLAATESIRPGVSAVSVDGHARRILKRHGLEEQFIHSTGHGLGLEIHEPPRLGKLPKTRAKSGPPEQIDLQAGMVITVEPGAYLEGFGGVRIEDTVLVTETGHEVLTPTSKELRVL